MSDNTIIGKVVFENWKVIELIGAGSFGSVYKIQREEYGHTYIDAMKLISIPASKEELQEIYSVNKDEESVRAYFNNLVMELVNEIRLMDKLKGNSNVVSYEDHLVVEKKNEIGWDVYIKMELLTPMNTYLEQESFTVADVIILGIHMCKALEFCLNNEIIHRDIKPQNIFISKHGYFKLGDFGIAKQLEREVLVQSKKGTFVYMAPEVYLGKPYDESVDTYSLGLVLYRLLNDNRTPFLPYHPAAITYSDKENSLSSRMSGLAIPPPRIAIEPLIKIIFKACAFKPEDRYKSPTEMSADLEKIDLEAYKNFKVSSGGTDINEASSSRLFGGNASFVIPNSIPQSKEGFKGQEENISGEEDVWGTRKSLTQTKQEEETKDYSQLFSADGKTVKEGTENTSKQGTESKNKKNPGKKSKKTSLFKKIMIILSIPFVLFIVLVIYAVNSPDVPSYSSFKYSNGDNYEGYFLSGIKEGKGIYTYASGDKYEGQWVNGKKDGNGIFYYKSGSVCEGIWKEGLLNGYAVYKYADGSVYQGRYVNDLKDDINGKLIYKNGDIYTGAFTKGQLTGYAEMQVSDGIYKGQYINAKREGEGTFYYSSPGYEGDYYKGQWKAGKQNGNGQYYDHSKNTTTKGVWQDGKMVSVG